MPDDPLESVLRQWNEAIRQDCLRLAGLCDDGPTLAALYLHVVEGLDLSSAEARHVEQCPRCSSLRTKIDCQVAAGTISAARPAARRDGQAQRAPAGLRLVGRPLQWIRAASASHRRRWTMGGSLAAACVLAALFLLWPSPTEKRAVASDMREVGYARPIPFVGLWAESLDEVALAEARRVLEQTRSTVAEAIAIDDRSVLDPWPAWTALSRELRSMGRWQEALTEALAFADYARQQNEEPERYSMYYSALADVGRTYLAIGDYESAKSKFNAALREARDYQEWFVRSGLADDPRPHAREMAFAGALSPLLSILGVIASADGDQETAWAHHAEAGQLLQSYFEEDCAYHGLTVSPDASLLELCMAVAAAPDQWYETPATLVRQHLLYESQLLRVDRKIGEAVRALDRAMGIPYYPHSDEDRQDFYIPVEAMRLAIARGDFAAALAHADEAEGHTGPRVFDGRPYQPAIGVLARAELRYLRGVARAGLAPDDPEALKLIESAIEAIAISADSLPESQQERLLVRFSDWMDVAGSIRAAPSSSSVEPP